MGPAELVSSLLLILALPVLGGLVAAVLIRRRGGPSSTPGLEPAVPHRGPNVANIPVAGWPGLIVVLGYIWMFWFGIPGFRPLVVMIGVLGVAAGAVFIVLERRHTPPTSTPLGLHDLAQGHAQKKPEP